MARIAGVDLPNEKRADIALTYIFGIGRVKAVAICATCEVDGSRKVKDLNEQEIRAIREEINNNHKVEGPLRTEIQMNIKRLMDRKGKKKGAIKRVK